MPLATRRLTTHNIENGGKLVFIMNDKPNKEWDTNKEDILHTKFSTKIIDKMVPWLIVRQKRLTL